MAGECPRYGHGLRTSGQRHERHQEGTGEAWTTTWERAGGMEGERVRFKWIDETNRMIDETNR